VWQSPALRLLIGVASQNGMAGVRASLLVGAGLAAGLASVSYPLLLRDRCVTWGANRQEAASALPGDDLMPDPDIVTTRAVWIDAPPERVWPWIVQMGSGRAGAYTYDWVENLFGMDMHSADVILPQFQDVKPGDEFPLASGRGTMRVEIADPGSSYVVSFAPAGLVWIFALTRDGTGTRLLSRNRIRTAVSAPPLKMAYCMIMEPGSLVRERKMLLGIKNRAERLNRERQLEETRTDTIA
jgi:hypothetical protein